MKRILLIEDDPELQKVVSHQLKSWYLIAVAGTLAEARGMVEKESFDLILLDVQLPDGNGFEFCVFTKNNLKSKDTPVIFLTSRDSPIDKMMGFSLGADDYLVKPFEPIEARARIEARLKSRQTIKLTQNTQTFANLKFDCVKQRVFAADPAGERDLNLTPFEFKLLYYLALRSGQVFSRSELMKNVMDQGVHVNEDSLYTHISSVRKKLGVYRDLLESIPRVGYRFKC
jgi:two-component system phosphate regulon response regulator PhoB